MNLAGVACHLRQTVENRVHIAGQNLECSELERLVKENR